MCVIFCFKRLVEAKAMLQVAGVYVNAVSNHGCLSKLENWVTLTIRPPVWTRLPSLETPPSMFGSYILFYPALQREVPRNKYLYRSNLSNHEYLCIWVLKCSCPLFRVFRECVTRYVITKTVAILNYDQSLKFEMCGLVRFKMPKSLSVLMLISQKLRLRKVFYNFYNLYLCFLCINS